MLPMLPNALLEASSGALWLGMLAVLGGTDEPPEVRKECVVKNSH